MTKPHVTIVGAGLVGSLLACFLGRRGYQIDVYERREDPRSGASERGRSINLALSERGLDALRRINLVESVMEPALPMYRRIMHQPNGAITEQPYSSDGKRSINSIGRSALNETLLDAAEATPGVSLHFHHTLVGLDDTTLTFTTNEGEKKVPADIVLGADGGGSLVRGHLLQRGDVAVTEDILDYGYKELRIEPIDNTFALDPQALHIWPRGSSMMIALPNPDHSFTCTLFWPKSQFAELKSTEDVITYFAANYADAVPLMPNYVNDYLANPVGMLGTIHTNPWQCQGRFALIGDSAHAIVPFFGQGANCGFEDVVELDRCLDETGDDWSAALPLYEARRLPNAEAIAQMALENFTEMRDKVGSRSFLLSKQIEHTIERFVSSYQTRYEMVSFTTIPYAEVLERDAKQRKILLLGAVSAATALALGAVGAVRKAVVK
jgi:kynurenine 3-monooxygenase